MTTDDVADRSCSMRASADFRRDTAPGVAPPVECAASDVVAVVRRGISPGLLTPVAVSSHSVTSASDDVTDCTGSGNLADDVTDCTVSGNADDDCGTVTAGMMVAPSSSTSSGSTYPSRRLYVRSCARSDSNVDANSGYISRTSRSPDMRMHCRSQ